MAAGQGRGTWRYEEKLPTQAIIQKLARYVSGLHATDALLANGFIQEQMSVHIGGMIGTPRVREGVLSAWNYFLRGFMSLIIAANAFGDEALVASLMTAMAEFEKTDLGTE